MKNFYRDGHVMPGGDGSGERSPTQQVAVPRTAAEDLSTAPRTYSLVKFNSYRKRGKAGSPPATTSNPYAVLKRVDWLVLFSPWYLINKAKRYTTLLLPTIFVSVFICFSGAAKAQSRPQVGAAEAVSGEVRPTADRRSQADSTNRPVDLVSTGLQIGDKVPDVIIQNLYNYKTDEARLSDFKGKLLIIDFWATWCAPCVAMIPKMDSLQKQFGDRIQFLSVTYQSDKEVIPFLERFEKQRSKKYNIPYVTDDSQLQALFPHTSLPHYVWIDGDGVVLSVTASKDVNVANITKALSNTLHLPQKIDVKASYDKNILFLVNGNGGVGDNLLYHTVFTGYTDGLAPSYNRMNLSTGGRKITMHNLSMVHMMRAAYNGEYLNFGKARTIIESVNARNLTSSGKGAIYVEWLKNGNGFCYEIVVPPHLSASVFDIMKNDLGRLFPDYSVSVEQRKTMCWVLRRITDEVTFGAEGGEMVNEFSPFGAKMKNSTLSTLLMRLEAVYMQNSPYPIVDGTGFSSRVDLEINSPLSNMDSVNAELDKYGLQFILEEFSTHMLIIRDKV